MAGPAKPDPRKLAENYFTAPLAERESILKALEPFDRVEPADVESWRKSLLGWSVKAVRLPGRAKGLFYEKPDRGTYLLGGRKGGAEGLLIALHGGGAGAGDAGQAASAFGGAASSLGFRMIAPEVLEKTEHGWTDPPETERFVLDLLEALVRTERLDRNRIVLTGHSMGGYGTWTLGAAHADQFCGLAIFAGAPTCTRLSDASPISGVAEGILPNLRNLPVFVYQSGDDRNVPPQSNDFAMPELDRLEKADPGGYVAPLRACRGEGSRLSGEGRRPRPRLRDAAPARPATAQDGVAALARVEAPVLRTPLGTAGARDRGHRRGEGRQPLRGHGGRSDRRARDPPRCEERPTFRRRSS